MGISLQIAIATLYTYTQIVLRNRGISMSAIGLACSIGQLISIVLPIILGGIIDKRGKDQYYLFVLSALMIICYLPATVGNSDMLALIGITVFLMLVSCVSPITDGYQNRYLNGDSSKYGKLRSLGTMSYALTLIVAGVFSFPNPDNNKQIMIFIAAGCGILMVGALFAPDCPPVPVEKKEKVFDSKWFSKSFYLFMVIVALGKGAMGIIDRYLSSYMTEVMKLGTSFTLFYAISPFAEFFGMNVSGILLKKKKVDSYQLLIVSVIAIAVRFFIYGLTKSIVPFVISQLLHFFTFGAFHMAVVNYIDENVAKEHYSSACSFYWAIGVNLPQAIAAFVGGLIIDKWGYDTLFLGITILPLLATVLCLSYRKMLTSRS